MENAEYPNAGKYRPEKLQTRTPFTQWLQRDSKNLDSTFFKDTQMEKITQKLNSSPYEKYEYEHLGRWYIKLTPFKTF